MQAVILAKNAALSEMHSLGSSSVDAMYFKGHGDTVTSFNITETGMKIFTMHHTGDRNFAITLKDENGKYIALLANELANLVGAFKVGRGDDGSGAGTTPTRRAEEASRGVSPAGLSHRFAAV